MKRKSPPVYADPNAEIDFEFKLCDRCALKIRKEKVFISPIFAVICENCKQGICEIANKLIVMRCVIKIV